MGSVLVQGLGSRAVSQGGWADVLGAMLQVLQALTSAEVGSGLAARRCCWTQGSLWQRSAGLTGAGSTAARSYHTLTCAAAFSGGMRSPQGVPAL